MTRSRSGLLRDYRAMCRPSWLAARRRAVAARRACWL